ncbi:MAG TPA: radical SAM protein [Edaphocola sp.]|nr:radical SAM protein [Edaphocola sp.]
MRQMMVGNLNQIVKRTYQEQNYSVVFNKKTGFFARIEKKGYDEPFWSKNGPELLDISITNYCEKGCDICYRNSNIEGKHISLSDYNSIIEQAQKIGVLQVAIGGGNPNQHPHFVQILKSTFDNGIVPSYTSNGEGLTDEILLATQEYCGAMALSAYKPYKKLNSIIDKIHSYKIKLNIHFVLDKNTINDAVNWLRNPPVFLNQINAIIFLNYKPINSSKDLLLNKSPRLKDFFELVNRKQSFKIGFDSCSVSGIVQEMNINPIYFESCEAAKFSAFISEEMKMYPCSFMADTHLYADLRNNSIQDVWQNNEVFKNYRNSIKNNNCKNCDYEKLCQGGCLFLPEIVLCNKDERLKSTCPNI